MKLVKVFVKGWIETDAVPYIDKKPSHHSTPVRFKCEDGSYEWLWVRKNNVTLCRPAPEKER